MQTCTARLGLGICVVGSRQGVNDQQLLVSGYSLAPSYLIWCYIALLYCSMQATAADLLEVERGLCQLQQLGVPGAVLAAMASQAHNKRATLQLSAADLVRGGRRREGRGRSCRQQGHCM